MARSFSAATAEQVLIAAEAVVAFSKPIDATSIASFADLTNDQATRAADLAVDLGLIKNDQNTYLVDNPLSRMLRTPHERERAAVLRISLEIYEPFCVFREELDASGDAGEAAKRTKEILDLGAHREEVKDTLLSLATFSGALVAAHGGKYTRDSTSITKLIGELAQGCEDVASSIQYVRTGLGAGIAGLVSHDNVILPIATALRHALADASREAVMHTGNAIDTFLDEYGVIAEVNLEGKHGINAKIDELKRQTKLSTKLSNIGKYLGHIRNGADHGVDQDVGVPWNISRATGMNYIGVAISFIRSVLRFHQGNHEL